MSNIINIQSQIQKLSQELIVAEQKMHDANSAYDMAVDDYWDNRPASEDGDISSLDSESSDPVLLELLAQAEAAEAHYDSVEDEIFNLEEELEELFADEHSRTDEDS